VHVLPIPAVAYMPPPESGSRDSAHGQAVPPFATDFAASPALAARPRYAVTSDE